jgi:NodT family efflux transporter outer membrane factor (OMF) lipoprotein
MRLGSRSRRNKMAGYKLIFPLLLPLFAALPACTVGPDYHPPAMPTPKHWVETQPLSPSPPPGGGRGFSPQSPEGNIAELAHWWHGFNDGKLNSLIARALQGNLDVQAADARLSASRAQIAATAAGLWPRLNASGGYQRERLSPNALKGILGGAFEGGESTTGLLSSLGPIGTPFNLFQAGFDSSWELDIFGGIKRQQEAALANAEALEESRRDLRITLTAEVARHYLELIALQRRLQIARQRVDIQRQILSLAGNAYDEGLASALDVKRSTTELETVASAVPAIKSQIKNTRHGLALLLGLQPGALERELANLKADIPPPPTLAVGAPADLLRRRPDIRRAERTVASANAFVGAAVAELFPKITLTGSVGLQSQDVSDFASFSSGFYGFGPRLSLPIFQAGRLLANIDIQEAKTAEALKAYEKTVLTAFREVEDSLAAMNGTYQRTQALLAAETSARLSFAAATAIYTEGETELQAVLDTQRTWFDVQEQLVQSQLAWATGHIALFKALGGGWDSEPAKRK